MQKFQDLEKELSNTEDTKSNLEILKELSINWETYIYIKDQAKYFWVEKNKFFRPNDVSNNLMLKWEDLKNFRIKWEIKTYDDIVYLSWGCDKSFNLLDESLILKPSSNPILHWEIKKLIDNVCWNKKENIDYLHKIILYKYLNLNDYTIPCIVLYWVWWSGKGTLMSLFGTIYWEVNVLANLWQRDLIWAFDTYKGGKLIVEFAEVITNNTSTDKWVLNKLKNIIWADKINVNEKWIQAYQINNIAQFFISSNSDRPIQLDEKEKWNRRFVVIKSMTSLSNW